MKRQLLTATLTLITIAASYAEDINGLWKWTTPGQNGGLERIFNLRVKADSNLLTGTILSPQRTNDAFTEFAIKDGRINGHDVSFNVARPGRRGINVFVTRYSGKLNGDKIEGKIESPGRNGKTQSVDWKAERNTTGQLIAGSRIVIKPGYNEAGQKIVNETHFKELTADETEKYIAEHPDAVILDTRAPDEFASGHIPNSQNHDLTNEATYKDVLAKLDKSKWYVVLSAGGHYRTVRALEYFEANGFPHAVALKGGFSAWEDAGKPSVK